MRWLPAKHRHLSAVLPCTHTLWLLFPPRVGRLGDGEDPVVGNGACFDAGFFLGTVPKDRKTYVAVLWILWLKKTYSQFVSTRQDHRRQVSNATTDIRFPDFTVTLPLTAYTTTKSTTNGRGWHGDRRLLDFLCVHTNRLYRLPHLLLMSA